VLCLGLAFNLSSSLAWCRSWSCSACIHHRGQTALVLRGEGRPMEIIPHLRSSTKGGLASAAKGLKQVCPLRSLLPVKTPPTHPQIPTLALSFAFCFAAPPVQQATLPASSVKTSTVGVCMAPLHISPLPHYCTPRLHSLPPRQSPKLALSFAGITSGRGGQRATLPATSSKKSRAGVSLTLPTSLRCRTTPLHALPYSQHYACFILASLALLT
jgi:hypothetical protein